MYIVDFLIKRYDKVLLEGFGDRNKSSSVEEMINK